MILDVLLEVCKDWDRDYGVLFGIFRVLFIF